MADRARGWPIAREGLPFLAAAAAPGIAAWVLGWTVAGSLFGAVVVFPQSIPPGAGWAQPGRVPGRRPRAGGGGRRRAPLSEGAGGAGERLSEPAGRAHQPHAVRRAREGRFVQPRQVPGGEPAGRDAGERTGGGAVRD